jgi:iron complex transport system substrate-binding protein
MRIVSLLPSATEIVYAQDLCRVCALPTDHVADALDYLGCTAEVVSLDPHSLDDVLATILTVGRRTGTMLAAERLVTELQRRLATVADRVAGQDRPAVAVVEWVDPPFTAGHWVPDLVTAAGGRPVAARPGRPSVETTWDRIAAARPDVIVVSPCGFHLDGAAAQAELVARRLPGIPVWAIDAGGIVVRPGPRLVDGVEALAAVLHPDLGIAVPDTRTRRVA